MQPEVVSDQTVRGGIFAIRGAESEEGAVLQEDQIAAGAQEPGGLGDPAVGIAPYARAVLGEGEIEAEAVLSLEPAGCLELLGRVVDTHHACAPPREPGRPVGGAAAELYDVLARHVRHDPKVALGYC